VPESNATARLERTVREESGRILATLIGLLGGDFDLAEDAFQDACTAALERWPQDGVPANPRAWLISAARFRAIDRLRRARRFEARQPLLALSLSLAVATEVAALDSSFPDERIKLLFTCCHPALAPEARIALTLRTLCGLSSEEIARAFLSTVPTIQQRIVRAKAKIRDAGIPYRVPDGEVELSERLAGVLRVVYLVFTEGYAATHGPTLVRADLCAEAIRLARLLDAMLPDRGEILGLLALLLLQDSRQAARVDAQGDLVRLTEQNRSLWDDTRIREGLTVVSRARRLAPHDPYVLQAAIAAQHASAAAAEATDWTSIAALYDRLFTVEPTPMVGLSRAIAHAEASGPARALPLLEELAHGTLEQHHLLHTARGEILARLGRVEEAAAAYDRALSLVTQETERRFLLGRRAALGGAPELSTVARRAPDGPRPH
jgi:RNA polymerase sigma-70 factor (ECF subfamily)